MALRKDGNFKPDRHDVNVLFMNGGVGDHIGTLVAVNYILENYPWLNLLIWVPNFLLDFAKNVLPKKAIVRNFTDLRTKYDREKITLTTEWDGRISPMKMHTVDYAFLKLTDEVVSIEKKNYLKVKLDKVDIRHYNLPSKYIVIPPAFTADAREFKPPVVNAIVDYALSKGYQTVFLGQTTTPTGGHHNIKGAIKAEIDFTRGINLINKTSLLQVAKICHGAAAVVGVDCGILHVAGCTDAPIVAGFTTVNPENRAPIRRNQLGWNFYPVVPDESLDCRFCQVKTNFLYKHDYTQCIYKDFQCVSQLTPEKFISQLDKLLT